MDFSQHFILKIFSSAIIQLELFFPNSIHDLTIDCLHYSIRLT